MNPHILKVFLYELKRNITRKGYLFTTFGLPLIVYALLFGYQFITNMNDGEAPEIPINSYNIDMQGEMNLDTPGAEHAGYVDLNGILASARTENSDLVAYPDEASAQAAIEAGEIDAYYVVAEDYLESGVVTLVLPTLSIQAVNMDPIEELLVSALAGNEEDNLLQRLNYPANITGTNVQFEQPEGTMQDFDASFLLVYVFVLMLMVAVFTTNGYLMQGLIEEKETRVIEVLITTLRPVQLLVGKIFAFGLLGLLQITVWVGAFILLLQMADVLGAISVLAQLYMPLHLLPLLLVYFVLAYLFFATAYGIVGALSTSSREGPQLAVIFTLPAMVPLYFLSLFVEAPDSTLPVVLSLIPITAPISMVQRILISAVPAWQIILSIVLLCLFIAFLMWVAGRLFRVQTLLAGQTPRLKDIPRLIFS